MAETTGWIWGILALVFCVCAGSLFYIYWLYKWVMGHSEGPKEMQAVSDPIREGAFGFLHTQYRAIGLFSIPVACIIFLIYALVPGSTAGIVTTDGSVFPRFMMAVISTLAFSAGAACSALSGWFGMWVSVRTNVRCAAAAMVSSDEAIKVALRGGAFSGMLIVTLSLFGVGSMFGLVHAIFPTVDLTCLSNVIVGYGFGASFVALFAQLGGGIYTKAADVGCDLVGKVNHNIPEDDPRNPAVIADLVGDNVGDCAGRGADLFESTAAENIGAMVIGGAMASLHKMKGLTLAGFILFPLVVRAFGLCASMVGIVCVYSKTTKAKSAPASPAAAAGSAEAGKYTAVDGVDDIDEDPLFGLIRGFAVASGICSIGIFLVSYMCLNVEEYPSAWIYFSLCGLTGIVISLLFVFITQYYTDYRFRPVMSIAKASETGHATNIIAGLAVGMESTCLPVLVISAALVTCYYLGKAAMPHAGFFGTACGTMGMLMVVAFVLAMDTFGPISDNAGGIVEMSEQPEHIRAKTDRLDAVGNTTKALTKGYAVGSAALATFLLFSAFLDTVKLLVGDLEKEITVDLGTPEVFCGGLIGGMLVYLFSAWAIDAVGNAAQQIIEEVNTQFAQRPGIMNRTEKPDYQHCVTIVTQAALREMIKPALLIVCTPIVLGLTFRALGSGASGDSILGARVLGSMLMIATITGVLCGLFLNNAGGAWDNAKKFIEMGNFGGKGSDAHKAAVTGDTVGDPSKDTAGPSIHVLIKLLSTITLVMAPIFVKPKSV